MVLRRGNLMEVMSEFKMLEIFIQKSCEYGLEKRNLFIGSRSTTSVEFSTKQDVSFNLSERKNYHKYEYAVKWISSNDNDLNHLSDDDIYIIWPIKDSKCKALTLSAFVFFVNYRKSGIQVIHKRSNIAEYDVWLFKRKYIDEFFQKVMLRRHATVALSEETNDPFETRYIEGGKRYYLGSHYERDTKLRDAVINRFKAEHKGRLFCSICGFDFSRKYGNYGSGFIEVHHIKPLAEDEREADQGSVDELICVCLNCHRMLHHKKPAIKPDDLKKLFTKENFENDS